MKNKFPLWTIIISLLFLSLLTTAFAEEELTESDILECQPDWICTAWSDCVNEFQNRSCTDSNFCGNEENKPVLFKDCEKIQIPEKLPPGEETGIITEQETFEETPEICLPDWKCAPWSRCVDNIQSRICFDDNGCNTEDGKPSEEQSCTSTNLDTEQTEIFEPIEEEQSSFFSYILIFGLLIFLGGGGFVAYTHFTTSTNQPTQPNIQTKTNVPDPMIQYVNQMRAAGYNDEQIRNELVKSGYDQETINQTLPVQNAQLKQYTKQMLQQGYNHEQIEDHLTRHGYDLEQIKEYIIR